MQWVKTGFIAAAAAVFVAAAAGAGVDSDLIFKRITESRAAAVSIGERSVPIESEAQVLLVRRADPAAIKDGEWVSSVKEPGDGAPLWLLIGGDTKQVQRLVETAEIKTPEAKKVGGIGTCSLYTPCPKCRRGFEETIAKRKLHPPALRVQAVPAGEVRTGQLLAAGDVESKRRPLLVFEDERAAATLNQIRNLATRSNRLTR
jgi:hypothetical protein